MPTRRTLLKGTLFGSAAALLPTPASASDGGPLLCLPAPSGPYPVGLRKVHLTDPSRPDPWVGGVRELMLTVLYPARSVRGFSRAPQLTPGEAKEFADLAPLMRQGLPEPGAVDWGAVLTHGHVGAPPLPGRRPVLVYSPGGGDSRTLGTSLAEDLASHGRVVVLVDHPGDASQVELPTGMRTTVLFGPPDPATFRTMVDTRIADLRFVLDRLSGLPLAPVMDLGRIGLYGHSAGGTAVVYAARGDRRVDAVANLEGYLDLYPATGLGRPLLLCRTDGFEGAPRIESSWADLPGSRALLTDANHWSFTDLGPLVAQLRTHGLVTATARTALIGDGDPAVTLAAVRRRVGTFFARHLS
ncbi:MULTISPECIES: alpha/beta hydrolase family protein [Streptomyces]|uniref:Acetylhydrolase n=1 Tax=Streptomyces solicathayae TaxID=3081768 RepID=A0ABZ0LMT3_9ACTN|nr:acetylhydrolase [Streptomyces sp. HUAS YS2]WOX20114.1 acetylhydrolase [Streptomyces sp. HUAS YS2]